MSKHKLDFQTVSLFAGLILTLMFIWGSLVSVNDTIFSSLWVLHLVLFVVAVGGALVVAVQAIKKSDRVISILSVISSLLIFTIIIVQSRLPITARDALIHHLAVPQWWLEKGYIFEIPWHEWSYYPMLIQLAYTGFLNLGFPLATPLYHAGYLVLLAALALLMVKEKTQSDTYSVIAWIVTLTTPVYLKLATIPLVDLSLAYYCLLAIYYALPLIDDTKTLRFAVRSGIALGLALATKLNALLFAAIFIPTLALSVLKVKKSISQSLKLTCICGVCALLVYSPWLIRNYLWTENPFFPLYKSIFSKPTVSPLTPEQATLIHIPRGFTPIETRLLLHKESLGQVLMLPFRIFISGEDDNPALFDGRLAPFLLLFLIPLFITMKDRSVLTLSLGAGIYILLSLLMSDARVRYMAPVFGVLVVCGTIGLVLISKHSKQLPIFFLLLQLLWVGVYVPGLLKSTESTAYLASSQTPENYLSSELLEYPLIQFINSETSLQDKTYLLLTGNRFYYFTKPIISAGHSSANELLYWIAQSKNAAELDAKFQALGVTYIFTHATRLKTVLESALTDPAKQVWNEFVTQYVIDRKSDRGFIIWQRKGATVK